MLEQRPIPYDLLKPITGGNFIEGGNAYKPRFGMMGSVPVRIFIGRNYNEVRSKELGLEIWDEEELVEFRTDKFSKHTPRVKDLADWQLRELGPLIQDFREQRDSKETSLDSWQVLNENDKFYLASQGIRSVEQLAALDPARDTDRFGRNSEEFILKARRHLATKGQDKEAELRAEMKALREEIERIRGKERASEDAYLQSQVAKSENPVMQVVEQRQKRKYTKRAKPVETESNETTA
jgi:hypothetical protein